MRVAGSAVGVARRAASVALPLLVLLALLSVPSSARAQVILREGGQYGTPQHFAFELRFGPYHPAVDSEFVDRGLPDRPYRRYFGRNDRLMTQIELDYQVLQGFGSLGAGFSVGWFRDSAKAFLDDGTRAADETTIDLVPMSVSAVYRADWLAVHSGIPIVPYLKLGLDYTIWVIREGNGRIAEAPSGSGVTQGRGATPGWHAAIGAAVMLDVLDPDAARELDWEIGVNHTYLFFELVHYDVSGFEASFGRDEKSRGSLRVGDNTWLAGVMFEF